MSEHKIQTERFVLKVLSEDDASERYLSWLTDDESANYIANRHEKLSELKAYIAQKKSQQHCYFWGIFIASDMTHIGNVKYEPLDYSDPTKMGMGILIGDTGWRGKGVAVEVLKATCEYLFSTLGVDSVYLGVEKDNVAAIKAYQRVGFDAEAEKVCGLPETSVEMVLSAKR